MADFATPVQNAAAVARAIRERLPQLPILFVSGYTDTAALEAAAGNAPQLRKPSAAIRVRLDQQT